MTDIMKTKFEEGSLANQIQKDIIKSKKRLNNINMESEWNLSDNRQIEKGYMGESAFYLEEDVKKAIRILKRFMIDRNYLIIAEDIFTEIDKIFGDKLT